MCVCVCVCVCVGSYETALAVTLSVYDMGDIISECKCSHTSAHRLYTVDINGLLIKYEDLSIATLLTYRMPYAS